MNEMRTFIIGYGSLMNVASRNLTGSTGDSFPMLLGGYRREWGVPVNALGKPTHGWTAMAVAESHQSRIAVVAMEVDESALILFDARERGYRRIAVPASQCERVDGKGIDAITFFMYVPEISVKPPTLTHPIALTYIDVIASGALQVAPQFAQNFFEECEGWTIVLDDRANPQYESAVKVSDEHRTYIDAQLKRLNVRMLQLSKK